MAKKKFRIPKGILELGKDTSDKYVIKPYTFSP
jgi:hypothetical protein